jgi:hypothetical protein
MIVVSGAKEDENAAAIVQPCWEGPWQCLRRFDIKGLGITSLGDT